MPTVLRSGPYRFFFYSNDGHEPVHVHIERDDRKAKFWLGPLVLQSSAGLSRAELNAIQRLLVQHHALLLQSWHDYFGA